MLWALLRSCCYNLVTMSRRHFLGTGQYLRFTLEMAKGSRGRRRMASRHCRYSPYPLHCNHGTSEDICPEKCPKGLDKKEWKDATCSVCIEYPHNAVLLLCSSHDKGCRPYMCGTSFRYSNCLDQYKKAYTKVSQDLVPNPAEVPDSSLAVGKCEAAELACPLCRGQVKGWTVVEPAREYLNLKKRSCMQENCPFVGNYKELRKHVKADHPSARPREVDPSLEQKWRRLEREREHNDVISTIRSTMPGAMVFGDYVIEGNNYGLDSDDEDDDDATFFADPAGTNRGLELGVDGNMMNVFLLLHAFGQSGNAGRLGHPGRTFGDSAVGARHTSPVVGLDSTDEDDDSDDGNDNGNNISLVNRLRRHGRVLLGRSGRRQRQREADRSQR